MKNDLLQSLSRELRRKYRCHTLILYGSRARGDAHAVSDVDLIGFRARGPVVHEARKIKGTFLDAFVYPDNRAKATDLLRIRGGKVLFQKKRFGDALLARVEKVYAEGPKPLSAQHKKTVKIWSQKMLERIKTRSTEADFRRVWLLTALLEDYFNLRGLWYEGPKAGLKWLAENDSTAHARFERALRPKASLAQIERLVKAVTGSRQ
jgi:hypothetical protein